MGEYGHTYAWLRRCPGTGDFCEKSGTPVRHCQACQFVLVKNISTKATRPIYYSPALDFQAGTVARPGSLLAIDKFEPYTLLPGEGD